MLTPTAQVDARYLGWLAQSNLVIDEIVARSVGVSYPAVNPSDVGDVDVPVPSLDQQRLVAAFLEKELADMDEADGQLKRLRDLIQEREEAVVENELAGLRREDPVVKIGWFVDVQPGFAFSSEGFVTEPGVGMTRLLRGINVSVGETRWDDVAYWREDDPLALRYRLAEGDVVIGMDRPFIAGGFRAAVICAKDLPCSLVQRVLRLRAKNGLDANYLWWVLKSPTLRHHLEPDFTGVSVPHISDEQVRSFQIPFPPLSTQMEVVRRIESRMSNDEASFVLIDRQLELLAERRQVLITEAVAGRLEIEGVPA